jgi:hypothetical protein
MPLHALGRGEARHAGTGQAGLDDHASRIGQSDAVNAADTRIEELMSAHAGVEATLAELVDRPLDFDAVRGPEHRAYDMGYEPPLLKALVHKRTLRRRVRPAASSR